MTAGALEREVRSVIRSLAGTRAGHKTERAHGYACTRQLTAKARAWEAMSRALDANARGESHSSAADVCSVGFALQEEMRRA